MQRDIYRALPPQHAIPQLPDKTSYQVIIVGASPLSPLLGLNESEDRFRESRGTFCKALPTAKSIVITGGGLAGIETAGELGEHLNGRAGRFSSALSNITVVTSGSRILPALRSALAKKAEECLAKVGVTAVKDARVKTVEQYCAGTIDIAAKAALTLENCKKLETDLYIPTTGTRPNTFLIDKALLTANGRVDTNASTLLVNKGGPRIYAVGGAASCARPAVHLILNAITVLFVNIKRDLLLATGKEEISVGVHRLFLEDTRETQLVPIGKHKGIGAAMGWQVPSFMVWLMKGRDYWLSTTGGLWSGKQWAKKS